MKNIKYSLIAIVLLLSACNNNKIDSESDQHLHEEESISFTEFSLHYEMFAEIVALQKGKTTEVLAHFTKLENYKPVINGSLDIILEVGSKKTKIAMSEPTRAGIFVFKLHPQASGHGHLKFIINSESYTDTLLLHLDIASDEKEQHAGDCDHTQEVNQKENEGITFLKEQAWKTDFNIYKSRLLEFSEVIPATGEIQATSVNDYLIVAKHSGIIIFEMDNLLPGMELGPKDDILIVGSEDIIHDNFETKFAKVKLEFEKAEKDYNRSSKLYADKIIAEKEYLEIEKEYFLTKKDMDLFKAHYKPGGHHIHLKQKGYLKRLLVEEGEYVEIGQPMLEITKSNTIILKAEVQQKYIASLSKDMSANFKVNYFEKYFDIVDYEGKLLSIGQSIEKNTTLVPVYFEFTNPDNILPGSFASVYLKIPKQEKKLIVPIEALIETQGNYALIVQLEGELYSKRDVKIGASDGQMVEILDGLKAGEVIVTTGAYRVYLASMASDLPAHAHVH